MRTCILLMRTPVSEEDAERLLGLAKESAPDVGLYLLGDGVLCARKGQVGYLGSGVKTALDSGAEVKASARDLRARGIKPEEIMKGVVQTDDLEGEFLKDAMERSGRVFSW